MQRAARNNAIVDRPENDEISHPITTLQTRPSIHTRDKSIVLRPETDPAVGQAKRQDSAASMRSTNSATNVALKPSPTR